MINISKCVALVYYDFFLQNSLVLLDVTFFFADFIYLQITFSFFFYIGVCFNGFLNTPPGSVEAC